MRGVINCMSWLLMSLSLLTRLIRLSWTVHLVFLVHPWFKNVYLAYNSQVPRRFELAAGLGETWCRDGGIPQGVF